MTRGHRRRSPPIREIKRLLNDKRHDALLHALETFGAGTQGNAALIQFRAAMQVGSGRLRERVTSRRCIDRALFADP